MLKSVSPAALAALALALMACGESAHLTSPTSTRSPVTSTAADPRASLAAAQASGGKSYLLDFTGSSLPGDLTAQVGAAGGSVTSAFNEIGVAVASSSDPAFAVRAAKISGIYSVEDDPTVQWVPADSRVQTLDADEASAPIDGAAVGALETFRPSQWAPDAVNAPAAWAAGAQGAGARVAVVDGGIRSTHIDIAPNLDVAHSASFVPGQPFNADHATNPADGSCTLNDTFWHGTHVAGIIAAPANNIGTVGIAPQATIIGVKVLDCGSGSFSAVIAGIMYAARSIANGGAGANVINMSLGAQFDLQGRGAAHLARDIGKATTFAWQQGVTVVAALGNNATDLDHTNNTIFLPAMSPHVIAVSATGPEGFALGATNFDRPASYTNFGQSAVSFAGPGGDFVLPGNATCAQPRFPSGFVVFPCWVFDMVAGPCRGSGASNSSYCWAAGTSMASPAVSGVAALIIGRFGPIGPAQVEARLRASADDLGKPGNDDFYGGGRVNAGNAVQ